MDRHRGRVIQDDKPDSKHSKSTEERNGIDGGKSLPGEVAFDHPRRFRTFLLAEQFCICSQNSFLKGCSSDRDFSVSVLVHKHPSQGLSCR